MNSKDVQLESQFVPFNDTDIDPKKFYGLIAKQLETLVYRVDLLTDKAFQDRGNLFTLKPGDWVCDQDVFFKKRYYVNGDCFAFAPPQCLVDAGILEIKFKFLEKSHMFVHHPGRFLSPNSRSRVDAALGRFIKIAVNHEVIQLLNIQDNCVENAPNTFDQCMYSELEALMLEEIGCTVPWLPNQDRICTEEVDRKRSFEIYQSNRRNQNNICRNRCLFSNMYFGPPAIVQWKDPNIAWVILYFRREVKTTTEYLLYSGLSMVAEIGGYVGLLLGVSLVQITGIINTLIDAMGATKVKQKSTNQPKRVLGATSTSMEGPR